MTRVTWPHVVTTPPCILSSVVAGQLLEPSGLQGIMHRPFSRLLDTVDRARLDRGSHRDLTTIPQQTTNKPGVPVPKPQLKENGAANSGSSASQGNNERRKSILKHRDPETEQLIPDPSTDSPTRKSKSSPVKFVGISNDLTDKKNTHRKWPNSPLPSRKVPRAPLADLLADFDGQESKTNSETNLMNDALLDQQNANTVLRCSRQACKLNAPAQNSSIIQDPLIAPHYIPLCMCGAPMTRLPAQNSNDNVLSASMVNLPTQKQATATNPLDVPTVSVSSSDVDKIIDKKTKTWLPPVMTAGLDATHIGRNGSNSRNCHNSEKRFPNENLNEDISNFVEHSATEETKLIEQQHYPRKADKVTK